jgi:hypothetical protein
MLGGCSVWAVLVVILVGTLFVAMLNGCVSMQHMSHDPTTYTVQFHSIWQVMCHKPT